MNLFYDPVTGQVWMVGTTTTTSTTDPFSYTVDDWSYPVDVPEDAAGVLKDIAELERMFKL